jgi:transposase-like protein
VSLTITFSEDVWRSRRSYTWHLDELFTINGREQNLGRAVGQHGDVIDILLQASRDQRAAERLLRELLRGEARNQSGSSPTS